MRNVRGAPRMDDRIRSAALLVVGRVGQRGLTVEHERPGQLVRDRGPAVVTGGEQLGEARVALLDHRVLLDLLELGLVTLGRVAR